MVNREIMIKAAENGFDFDVDVKEANGNAAVIVKCVAGNIRTTLITPVTGDLSAAMNEALENAAERLFSIREGLRVSTDTVTGTKASPIVFGKKQDEPKVKVAGTIVSDDELGIQETPTQGIDLISNEGELMSFGGSDSMDDIFDEKPEPVNDADDFVVAIGKHYTRKQRASVICRLIKNGDEAEKRFLKQCADIVDTAKDAKTPVVLSAEKFLNYARNYGISW